jgi:hypothetical protein
MSLTQPLGASAPGVFFCPKINGGIKMNPPKTRPHGGKREGAGRKPDWLKEKCKKLIDRKKLLDYLARVAAGEETEERATKYGAVTVAVSAHDRMHAIELLMDRGFGKALQAVEHSGSVATTFNIIIEGVDADR